jgi:hypothetical protein
VGQEARGAPGLTNYDIFFMGVTLRVTSGNSDFIVANIIVRNVALFGESVDAHARWHEYSGCGFLLCPVVYLWRDGSARRKVYSSRLYRALSRGADSSAPRDDELIGTPTSVTGTSCKPSRCNVSSTAEQSPPCTAFSFDCHQTLGTPRDVADELDHVQRLDEARIHNRHATTFFDQYNAACIADCTT